MTGNPINEYLSYCRAMNMAEKTIEAYGRSLRFLESFLATRNKQLSEARQEDLLDFITANSSWGPSTIANRLAAFRSYFKWAEGKRLLKGDNPMKAIRAPKQHVKRNKPSVTQDEVQLLQDSRRTHRDGTARPGDLRDRCLIALIYDTGIRVAEAVSLNVQHLQDMDPKRREFVYKGKGGSEYSWFVTEPIYELLMNYLRVHPSPTSESPLFLNRYGKRLSIRSVQKMLATRGNQVLGKKLHPHMLRRGFGNAFYQASGHDIYATSQAMHHSSVATTQGYLSISGDQLKAIVDAAAGKRNEPKN